VKTKIRFIVEGFTTSYGSDVKKWRQRVVRADHTTLKAARAEKVEAEKYHGCKHRVVKVTTTREVL
jgi:hypothetical protein